MTSSLDAIFLQLQRKPLQILSVLWLDIDFQRFEHAHNAIVIGDGENQFDETFVIQFAFELGKLGHLCEALAASRIATASPYASAYPEWTETREELDEKSRSANRSLVAFASPLSSGSAIERLATDQHQGSLIDSLSRRCRRLVGFPGLPALVRLGSHSLFITLHSSHHLVRQPRCMVDPFRARAPPITAAIPN